MNIYEQYKTIRNQMSILEIQESELKKKIIEDMVAQGKIKEGPITLASRKNYKYSPAVKEFEDQIKIMKVEEQEKGIATVEVTQYITYKEE